MRVTRWSYDEGPETVEVAADVDGFRVWYRVPRFIPISRTGDPFLASALLPAMLKGETLEIDHDLTVSPRLLRNIGLVQEIHHSWNPVLKIVRVRARTRPAEPLQPGAVTFFSGGVDSFYTFLKRRPEISHAVYIHGFDFSRSRDEFLKAAARNGSFVAEFGKSLIPVETNHYALDYHLGLSRVLTQGSTLASVAHLLGFPRAFIPASLSYDELVPVGSHPLLDPLFSTEAVEIVHDGAEARRVEKLAEIAACEPALSRLVVCIDEMNRNCGVCEKCLRTMISLECLGATTPLFPPLPARRTIRRRYRERYRGLLEENLELARRSDRPNLARVLAAIKREDDRKRLWKDADRVLFGGALIAAWRKIRRPPRRPINWIEATPPQN